jgi:23S rRNA pseudouridine1911/1915/1917 synthase
LPFVIKKFHLSQKQKAFLFLMRELGYSQREAQRFVARGRVFQGGESIAKASEEIEGEIEFIYFKPISKGLEPVFEAEEFVVYEKPSGMLVHPQNRHTEYSLIDELKFRYGSEANIVHRIDKETSGLVLCARNKKAEKKLKKMFEDKIIKKEYVALVHGEVSKPFYVHEPLRVFKDNSDAIIRSIVKVDKDGKASETYFDPIKYFKEMNMTLLTCYPKTGRQHQIRVHLFHVKHSIVGDPIYGTDVLTTKKHLDRVLSTQERLEKLKSLRMLLHANALTFQYENIDYHIQSSLDITKLFYDNVNSEKR